jgi:glyoxylase-like metal-dependent hydrolase (beta-lactamase superfamily II)
VDVEGPAPHSCVAIDASEGPPVLAALRTLAAQYRGRGVPPGPTTDGDAPGSNNSNHGGSGGGGSGDNGGESGDNGAFAVAAAAVAFDGFSDVLKLEAVLSTHRHWDHTFGNAFLRARVPSCSRVYGGAADKVRSH